MMHSLLQGDDKFKCRRRCKERKKSELMAKNMTRQCNFLVDDHKGRYLEKRCSLFLDTKDDTEKSYGKVQS